MLNLSVIKNETERNISSLAVPVYLAERLAFHLSVQRLRPNVMTKIVMTFA